MNEKDYSHVLDRVAGDLVPDDLNLAPNIIAQIQKRKGLNMQPRTKLIFATVLVAIVLFVVLYTAPTVAAAIGRWFGYVPGIGLVQEGSVRVLEQPVVVTRDGVTATVEQVVLNQELTSLVYSVEGIPNQAVVMDQTHPCPYQVALRLPDGKEHLASPQGMDGWATGYQHRLNFPAIPTNVTDATLTIGCLYQVKPEMAPEDWEIPLHFIPAPLNMTAFPVIEIATPTAAVTAEPSVPGATETIAAPAPSASSQAAITLTLDRAVQMDDGYLIYATVHWQDTSYAMVDVTAPVEKLRLLDSTGQPMRYEFYYDEQTGVQWDQRQTVFAIKTAPLQAAGPLTLALDEVSVDIPVTASFKFDPGSDPKPGQTWKLNQDLEIGVYHLRIRSATASENGYAFEMSSDNGIVNASLYDADNQIVSGGGGGGGGNPGDSFSSGFNYQDQLPEGPITVTIGVISIIQPMQLQAQWNAPAASPSQLPTQPAACLTIAGWQAAKAQSPALPAGLPNRVVMNGQLAADDPESWGLIISGLDGSNRQVIEKAQGGAFSPDGQKLAYSTLDDGIFIRDLSSGQTIPLPGTGKGDFNPFWTLDAQQIVFNRGMGIFDLYMVRLDGSNLRALTSGAGQEWPVGWLPDGQTLIYTLPGREYEYTNYKINTATVNPGQAPAGEVFSDDSLLAISPDGKYILTREQTFGDRWVVYVSDVDGANRRLLAEDGLWVLSPIWSPDGEWVLASVSDTDVSATTGALINLRTCQAISLPALQGGITTWGQ